jgi:hypothetical protein
MKTMTRIRTPRSSGPKVSAHSGADDTEVDMRVGFLAVAALAAALCMVGGPAEASPQVDGPVITASTKYAMPTAIPMATAAGALLAGAIVSRAKFKVTGIQRSMTSRAKRDESGAEVKNERGHPVYEPCEMQTIKMSPVYGNGDPEHENTKFWNASPSGSLELGCINLEAAQQFELDGEYYVDFTPAK